jgi:CelD/BcsL family acetyltransferase involved in cellulose biosynthesis
MLPTGIRAAMKTIVYEDPEECRQVWERIWPGKGLFDLWQVRSCFHEVFSRPLHFRVVEKNQNPLGFMALCWEFRKKLKADLKKLNDRKVSFRFNDPKDMDHLFRMNRESFGQTSYFSEARFYNAFERLAEFLTRMGMMRITTVLIDGAVAAVDMGALYKNSYTLLAGGTNPEFLGVAKLINLHHMEWSCHKRIETVDFLCGDFNRK